MKIKNKILAAVCAASIVSLGAPPPPGHHPGPSRHDNVHRQHPPVKHGHSREHEFWSGFAGAVVGSVIGNTISPPPPLPPPPPVVVVKRVRVWVPGYYENRIINGIVMTVWVDGHYEYR